MRACVCVHLCAYLCVGASECTFMCLCVHVRARVCVRERERDECGVCQIYASRMSTVYVKSVNE